MPIEITTKTARRLCQETRARAFPVSVPTDVIKATLCWSKLNSSTGTTKGSDRKLGGKSSLAGLHRSTLQYQSVWSQITKQRLGLFECILHIS